MKSNRVYRVDYGAPKRSWWAAHAAPGARDGFRQALRERIAEREHEANVTNYRAIIGARRSAGMQS